MSRARCLAAADSMHDKEPRPMPAFNAHSSGLIHRAALAAFVAAISVLAIAASSAYAAPAFDLSLSHSPSTLPRHDEQVTYTATVGNAGSLIANVGDTLTCNENDPPNPTLWFGAATFEYRWVANGSEVAGYSSAADYTVAAADEGKALQCLVRATNVDASASTVSFTPPVVVSPVPAPTAPPAPVSGFANLRPDVTGTATQGAVLECAAPTTWSDVSGDWTYQWLRNGTPILGATDSSYTVTSEDVEESPPAPAPVRSSLQCQTTATNTGGSIVSVSNNTLTSPPPDPSPPTNGAETAETPTRRLPFVELPDATAGAVTAEVELPPGMRVQNVFDPDSALPPQGWTCSVQDPSELENAKATCTRSDTLAPQASYPPISIQAVVGPGVADPATATLTASGGGAATVSVDDLLSFGPGLPFGVEPNTFLARALDSSGDDLTVAGGHPVSGTATFSLNTHTRPDGRRVSTGYVRSVATDLPAGFVGNPQAVPARCQSVNAVLNDKFSAPSEECPRASIVGGVTANTADSGPYTTAPLYAMPPERGAPAQFVFGYAGPQVTYVLTPRLLSEEGYAIRVEAPAISKGPVLSSVTVTLCGAGANTSASPSANLGHQTGDTLFAGCKQPGGSGANPQPFMTNPTACPGTPAVTRLAVDSWQNPGVLDGAEALAPAATDCDEVPFTPDVEIAPTSSEPDSPAGVDADISVPTDGLLDHDGISQSHLKKAVVTLPEGISVNPSAATGLAGCSDGQLGLLAGSNETQIVADAPMALSFDGQTTAALPYGAKRTEVEAALEALPGVGAGGVDVTGSGGGPWRVEFTGELAGQNVPQITGVGSEVQTLWLNPTLSAVFGTYTLTFDGETTEPLAPNASRREVADALEALPGIGVGDVVVTGGPIYSYSDTTLLVSAKTPYTIGFTGALAGDDVSELSVASSLFGGTMSVSTASQGGDAVTAFTHRAAGELRFNDSEPSCPDGSKIGTVDVQTPLIEEHLTGEVVLLRPKSTDPMSGEMLRMAIVARNTERGLLVKLPGSATADPQTGRLTATFDNNPQVPFSDLEVKFKGGSRGMVAMPQQCGPVETEAVLSPWSGNAPDESSTPLDVTGSCAFGFAPKLDAGMSNPAARGSGDYSFRFSREDGEQWVDGLTATLPQGLLASVRGVPLCSSADAAAGSCPAASRIGTVDASAGTGDPFVLERKGDAYLTQGYKGCAYGLTVKVPVIAGPFDASSPETDLGNVVVRQSVCVDRATAEVTVTSDPFPTIWHGIPLRIRSVTVKIDRAGFMLNPSDCTTKQTAASFHSERGTTATTSSPFQAKSCAGLPFKPRLGLRLTGRKQITTGKHPGIRALVRQNGKSEAGIRKAVVRLPKSLALDPNNAQALCEYEDGTKPDLDNRCPKGSIVGRARAKTPLLNDDLVGNVYFVKNVRKDPTTGNLIRTLPMIIVALRGEIAVNLKGESSTTKSGKLVNTFASVPDAPISQFNLNINGGKTGILAVTQTRKGRINICASRQTAEIDTNGQNGRRHDYDTRMKTPCTKKQTRNAKRAAANARAGSKRR